MLRFVQLFLLLIVLECAVMTALPLLIQVSCLASQARLVCNTQLVSRVVWSCLSFFETLPHSTPSSLCVMRGYAPEPHYDHWGFAPDPTPASLEGSPFCVDCLRQCGGIAPGSPSTAPSPRFARGAVSNRLLRRLRRAPSEHVGLLRSPKCFAFGRLATLDSLFFAPRFARRLPSMSLLTPVPTIRRRFAPPNRRSIRSSRHGG